MKRRPPWSAAARSRRFFVGAWHAMPGTNAWLLVRHPPRTSRRRHPACPEERRERSSRASLLFPRFERARERSRRISLGLKMLSWLKSKRGSSTPCPGASRKTKSAGHSAQNDGALPIKLLRHHIESNLQRPRRAQRIAAGIGGVSEDDHAGDAGRRHRSGRRRSR